MISEKLKTVKLLTKVHKMVHSVADVNIFLCFIWGLMICSNVHPEKSAISGTDSISHVFCITWRY